MKFSGTNGEKVVAYCLMIVVYFMYGMNLLPIIVVSGIVLIC